MKKLSRDEMKNLKGGDETVDSVGGGNGCMEEYTYECGRVRSPYPCCSGLVCVDNATNSGTICMLA